MQKFQKNSQKNRTQLVEYILDKMRGEYSKLKVIFSSDFDFDLLTQSGEISFGRLYIVIILKICIIFLHIKKEFKYYK
jgi:hypothetical protein